MEEFIRLFEELPHSVTKFSLNNKYSNINAYNFNVRITCFYNSIIQNEEILPINTIVNRLNENDIDYKELEENEVLLNEWDFIGGRNVDDPFGEDNVYGNYVVLDAQNQKLINVQLIKEKYESVRIVINAITDTCEITYVLNNKKGEIKSVIKERYNSRYITRDYEFNISHTEMFVIEDFIK